MSEKTSEPPLPKRKAANANDARPTLSVLMISPDPRVHGGVSVFAETMKSHLRVCKPTSFWIGSLEERKENLFQRAFRVCSAPIKIAMLVRRQRFDVVHINPSLDAKSLVRDGIILFALRLAGFHRVLVYFHGWEMSTERAIATNPLLRGIFTWLLRDASRIAVLSPDFKNALVDMGLDPARIRFTCTMFDGAKLEQRREAAPGARRSVLYMSRFVRNKGVYELLDAFARIAPDFPDTDLVMAGDGKERKGLERRAGELGIAARVRFTGYIGGAEKSRLLADCTLFTLPTYYGEGMPIALLEAMGAGKPLLTAKDGVIPHIITEPENGIVLDKVSAQSVEAALRRLLGDAEFCKRAGERNASYAWERFEAANVTASIETLYGEIARP